MISTQETPTCNPLDIASIATAGGDLRPSTICVRKQTRTQTICQSSNDLMYHQDQKTLRNFSGEANLFQWLFHLLWQNKDVFIRFWFGQIWKNLRNPVAVLDLDFYEFWWAIASVVIKVRVLLYHLLLYYPITDRVWGGKGVSNETSALISNC